MDKLKELKKKLQDYVHDSQADIASKNWGKLFKSYATTFLPLIDSIPENNPKPEKVPKK